MRIDVIYSLVAILLYVITQNQQGATLAANVNPATLYLILYFSNLAVIYTVYEL